ncbi:MAG: selenocysteine-specific translation elongation factor [Chloroflexota bacterium]
MTIVVGTAGHIDHGKTTLLRALTGIDADRLPEERRRGMTIDVGYAHLALPDGDEIDFVDVPGHDRLVGNMLVGAGEIDAALVVVAADDGPRAQTHEHVALLDALGVADGVAAVTKVDTVDEARIAEVVDAIRRLLAGTTLAGAHVVAVSAVSGHGLEALRAAIVGLRDGLETASDRSATPAPARLAVDRAFSVRGHGLVVTGSLRGGPIARGDSLRVVPGRASARVRGLEVHGRSVPSVDAGGGRVALNLAGVAPEHIGRGRVLTSDPAVVATDRLLVELRATERPRGRIRLHLGTDAVDAVAGSSRRDAVALSDVGTAVLIRLSRPVAAAPGDRFLLRPPAPRGPVGGRVLDVLPARGVSRRRQTAERLVALARALEAMDEYERARLALHGALGAEGRVRLAPDVTETGDAIALALVAERAAGGAVPLAMVRREVALGLRRSVTLSLPAATTAAAAVIEALVADGRLTREGESVRSPDAGPADRDAADVEAMDRLEAILAVPAPPSLVDAGDIAGCPPDAVRELERAGRIVVLGPDVAYAATTYRQLSEVALSMAADRPLTPAAYRDATGTSRKYVMAILEDLGRRGVLTRRPEGHVPGPRAGTLQPAP